VVSGWIYVGVSLASLIAGSLLTFLSMWVFDKFKLWRARKKIPRKEDGSVDKKALLDAGSAQINEKEVIEDERNRNERFREYEKLRHLSSKGTAKPSVKRSGEVSANEQSAIRRAVQVDEYGDDSEDDDDIRLH
jgi:hypothetical protein